MEVHLVTRKYSYYVLTSIYARYFLSNPKNYFYKNEKLLFSLYDVSVLQLNNFVTN